MARVKARMVYPDAAIPNGGAFGGTRNHRGVDHSQTHILNLHLSLTFTPWVEGRVVAIRRVDVGTYGRFIEIRDDEGVFTSYCHAASIDPDLHVGDRVWFSTALGVVGSSGTAIPPANKAGSKHLHTMCSTSQGAALNIATPVFDPLPHFKARLGLTPAASDIAPLVPPTLNPAPGDEEMFQYQKKSGTRFFVHPTLPVQRIADTSDFSANLAVGIRTERDVDNRKAEKFRKAHNARVKPLAPSIGDDLTDDVVQGVLDGLNLNRALAEQVADAVYDQIAAGGVSVDADSVKKLAAATVAAFSSALAPKPAK